MMLTSFTNFPGTMASQTTDFPLPSILQNSLVLNNFHIIILAYQLRADGFLSMQKFPLRLSISTSGKCSSCRYFRDFSTPY